MACLLRDQRRLSFMVGVWDRASPLINGINCDDIGTLS